MYLIGSEHPNKTEAHVLVEKCIADHERLVTDVEVFQEILHRYTDIDRREAIPIAFELLSEIIDEVFPITEQDVHRAKDIVCSPEPFSARDAIHLAVIERLEIRQILSFDQDFDRWPAVTRLGTA